MLCPDCDSQARVIDTLAIRGDSARRRRYRCTSCSVRFTTIELVVRSDRRGNDTITPAELHAAVDHFLAATEKFTYTSRPSPPK